MQEGWLKEGKKPDKDAKLWAGKAFEFFAQGNWGEGFTCLKIAADINPDLRVEMADGETTIRELVRQRTEFGGQNSEFGGIRAEFGGHNT